MENNIEAKEDYVRLIISDLHLGSAYSKEKQLYEFLSNTYFDEIILAGDILQSTPIRYLMKSAAEENP